MMNKNKSIIKNIKDKVIEINKNITKLENNVKHNDLEKINNFINNINKKEKDTYIPTIRNISVNKNNLFDKIGILDPKGLKNNPLTGEPYKNIYFEKTGLKYEDYGKIWSGYPMYEQKDAVINAVYNHRCVLITAGTGSGKTVLVPKYALHVLNYQGKIAITIPRRASTIKAADFAALNLDVELGNQVGYTVKDDKKVNPQTNLTYATDGFIVAKMKGNDPDLNEYDALIIDEVHERNVNIDLLLLMIKGVLKKRPNFKLILMSATIDPNTFLNYYKEFGMIHIEGNSKPNKEIKEIFLPPGKEVNRVAPNGEILSGGIPPPYIIKTVDIIFNDIIKTNKPGDILVLFPGKNDGFEACRLLEELINKEKKQNTSYSNKPFCIQLHSGSQKKTFRNATEENYATGKLSYKNLNDNFTRRIVMATEVAESSLTFSGDPIDWVIDTGLSNDMRYYPDTEVEALEKRYIAKANHKQRKGRTGRIQEGTCYNIFTEAEYKNFLEYPIAPIMQEDITEYICDFMILPYITHIDLPFNFVKIKENSNSIENETLNSLLSKLIEQPKIEYVNNSIKKLFLMGILNISDNKAFITPFGRATRFFRDIDLPKAACIVHSYNYKCSNEVIELMALLMLLNDKFSDIINKPRVKKGAPGSKEKEEDFKNKKKKLASSYGDHITLHNILETYKDKTYEIKWERGKQELIPKTTGEMGKGTIWAKENYINHNYLQRAFKLSKELNNSLGRVIGNYKRENPEKSENKFIFSDTAPIIHRRLDDNIMQAITLGYINNIAKKNGNKYSTCFPDVSVTSDIDRDSLFSYISVKPKNCIFSKNISISGMKKFQIFSKIPLVVLANIKINSTNIIKDCGSSILKKIKKNVNKKNVKFIKQLK